MYREGHAWVEVSCEFDEGVLRLFRTQKKTGERRHTDSLCDSSSEDRWSTQRSPVGFPRIDSLPPRRFTSRQHHRCSRAHSWSAEWFSSSTHTLTLLLHRRDWSSACPSSVSVLALLLLCFLVSVFSSRSTPSVSLSRHLSLWFFFSCARPSFSVPRWVSSMQLP